MVLEMVKWATDCCVTDTYLARYENKNQIIFGG